MSRADAWSGDQRAREALERSRASGRRMLALEVVCPADHAIVDVWATDEGDACTFRQEYDRRAVYESAFPGESAPDLTGSARDERHLEVRFLRDMETVTGVFCRCWRGAVDRQWLAGEVKAHRNSARRRVVMPATGESTVRLVALR